MAVEGKFISDNLCSAGIDMSPTSGLAGPGGTAQFLFLKIGGSKSVVPCAATSDVPIGVLQNAPASGAPASVAFAGVSKVVAGAAITAGAALMSDTAGRAITQTSTNPISGTALETALNVNQVIAMLIAPSIGAPG